MRSLSLLYILRIIYKNSKLLFASHRLFLINASTSAAWLLDDFEYLLYKKPVHLILNSHKNLKLWLQVCAINKCNILLSVMVLNLLQGYKLNLFYWSLLIRVFCYLRIMKFKILSI